MDSAKSQLIDRLKTANTVLITVSKNPTVDQLAACIGLTLIVNKLNKHGSAVFSGDVPSTIEFLKPEDTIEKNTDSLRDFIIALDKGKADKLRYKVEDNMVRIFITPYKTSISESDLEFTQGDFNVELIIALGVKNQEDLDQAITAHGRILHDATVASLNIESQSDLGGINWTNPQASSLCEIVCDLQRSLGEKLLDEQIATALLTGIVAETARFSNEKTSSQTMSVSAELMSAGANQQLVATELSGHTDVVVDDSTVVTEEVANPNDPSGTLSIDHPIDSPEDPSLTEAKLPAPSEMPADSVDDGPIDSSSIDELLDNNPVAATEPISEISDGLDQPAKFVTEPPQTSGVLTANSQPEPYEPSSDPLSNVAIPSQDGEEVLSKPNLQLNPVDEQPPVIVDPIPAENTQSAEPLLTGFTPPPPTWVPPFDSNQSEADNDPKDLAEPQSNLSEPGVSANGTDVQQPQSVDDARDQVDAVLAQSGPDERLEPTASLNAMPLGEPLHEQPLAPQIDTPVIPNPIEPISVPVPPADDSQNSTGLDPSLFTELTEPGGQQLPPPVPPPIPMP
jgi:nanoRNase/pAp phosphatase (c-di-AMP/oligoRNAs hydrolase)